MVTTPEQRTPHALQAGASTTGLWLTHSAIGSSWYSGDSLSLSGHARRCVGASEALGLRREDFR